MAKALKLRWPVSLFAVVLVSVLGSLLAFWIVCRGYATEAYLGPALARARPQEAIVVLAGDRNRISKGFELVRERDSPLLLLSGVEAGIPLVEIVNQQGSAAVNIHETWGKVVAEDQSKSTVENAEQALKILSERQSRSIILVTSDYHMPRALTIFKDTLSGIPIQAYPVTSEFSILTYGGLRRFFFEYWKYCLYWLGVG